MLLNLSLFLLFELLVLLFLSGRITKTIYTLLFLMIRSKNATIAILTLLYLPGTVVHEFAHLLVAEILRVPTGRISFTPEIEKNQEGKTEIQSGSVQVGRTDIVRRYLIGFAPVFFGLFFLALTIWIFNYFWFTSPNPSYDGEGGLQSGPPLYKTLFLTLIAYLLFAISNNMFSSRKDLEGFIFVVPILILIGVGAYFMGLRIAVTGQALEFTLEILTTLTKALGIVLGVNLTILLLNRFLLKIAEKVLRIKIA